MLRIGVSEMKNLPANARDAGDMGLIPGLGRSPGGENVSPLQYSWLKNPMDRGASVSQFGHSIVYDSFGPHGLQHARLPCPSPTPGAWSNLCPLSRWCHPTISTSVIPLPCLQSFPASGSFPMSQFFALGGQSIGASASTSFSQWIFRIGFL